MRAAVTGDDGDRRRRWERCLVLVRSQCYVLSVLTFMACPTSSGVLSFGGENAPVRTNTRCSQHRVIRKFGGRVGEWEHPTHGRGSVYPYIGIEYKPIARASNCGGRAGAGVHEPAAEAAGLGGLTPGTAGDVHAPGPARQARVAPTEALVSRAVHVRASVDAR